MSKNKNKTTTPLNICNDCGFEWYGDEGHCPDCDSPDTDLVHEVGKLDLEYKSEGDE